MGTLRFRLFGFPIAVLPGYWLLSMLLGLSTASRSVSAGAQLVGVMFVSILAHELGHAFAARAFGMRAQITLHMMGGDTAFAGGASLTRARDILISLAGPFAGLLLGASAWLLLSVYAPTSPGSSGTEATDLAATGYGALLQTIVLINATWSVLNLMPVIPFDGGRVLAAALGPRRQSLAGTISLIVGLSLALLLLKLGWWFAAVLFATAAVSSFLRLRAAPTEQQPTVDEGTLKQALRAAEEALRSEAFEQASQLSHAVLSASRNPSLSKPALQTLLWARLGLKDIAGARRLLLSTPADEVDPYLVGAVHEAASDLDEAQRALARARAAGDDRVEVTALLVKVLLRQHKFSAAANLTREILNRIQPLEARRVATEARHGGAQAEAAHLSLELAKAEKTLTDAAEALFGFALAGDVKQAAEAYHLATAIDAGGAKQLLEDERVRPLRAQLEALT